MNAREFIERNYQASGDNSLPEFTFFRTLSDSASENSLIKLLKNIEVESLNSS